MQPFEFESHLQSSVIIRRDVVNSMRRCEITRCISCGYTSEWQS